MARAGRGRLCSQKGWSSATWGAACNHAATDFDALALCDEDSAEHAEGYKRGPRFFTAYANISTRLLERENTLLDGVRSSGPAGF